MELVDVMAKGTMKAAVLQAEHKGIRIDPDKVVIRLRQVMKDGWSEFMETMQDANDDTSCVPLEDVANMYCNLWAVKAITTTDES